MTSTKLDNIIVKIESNRSLIEYVVIFSILTAIYHHIYVKKNFVLNDVQQLSFILNVLLIVGFMIYTSTKHDPQYKEANKQALIALFIAWLSHLDLVFTAFWFIWFLAYYIN